MPARRTAARPRPVLTACEASLRRDGLPRIEAIQNPYSLLNRSFEVGLAEFARRAPIGLLACSPLAFGVLSGKYQGGARPAGARPTLFARYNGEHAAATTALYVALARAQRLDPGMARPTGCAGPVLTRL